MNSEMKILGAVAAGAIIGTVAGILLAPQSGQETRNMLVDKSGDAKDKLADTVDTIVTQVKESFNKYSEKAAEKAKNAEPVTV